MDKMFVPFIIVGILCIIPVKNKKINFFLCIGAMTIMIAIFAFNNKSVDQYAYEVLYTDNDYFPVEKGYLVVCNLFRKLGLSYGMFKYVFASILSLLVYLRFKKYEFTGFRYALLSYFLSSYCFDAEQSRFTFAGTIVVLASCLLEKRGIIRMIIFAGIVALATTIHTSSVLYLALLLVKLKIKSLRVIALVFSFFTLVIGFLKPDLSFIGNLIYSFIPNERILMWFNFETNFGWIGPFLTIVLFSVFLGLSRKASINNDRFSDAQKNVIEFAYKTSLIFYISAPLSCFATDFIRIIRIFIPFYLAIIALVMIKLRGLDKKYPYAMFLILFPIFFAIQGKRGLLAYNDYYCSTLILKNGFFDKISTVVVSFFIILIVFALFAMLFKKKHKKYVVISESNSSTESENNLIIDNETNKNNSFESANKEELNDDNKTEIDIVDDKNDFSSKEKE